jgi:hypothetical protein
VGLRQRQLDGGLLVEAGEPEVGHLGGAARRLVEEDVLGLQVAVE